MLNHLYHDINALEYPTSATFTLPKTIKHENLVEINMNAFQETFELDKERFKELLGNLNWKKFSERIT